MLEKFDFYEFVGFVAPGAILIVGFILISNPDSAFGELTSLQLSIGDLGLFLILAYALGHMVQAVGNTLENVWWRVRRGWPTTRAGMRDDGVITGKQKAKLLEQATSEFSLQVDAMGKPASDGDWLIVVRRIYARVKDAQKTERVDLFNAMYGFSRGLTTGFSIIAIASFIAWGLERWLVSGFLTALAILSLYRMDRFGRHYARELFVQYLNLQPREEAGSS